LGELVIFIFLFIFIGIIIVLLFLIVGRGCAIETVQWRSRRLVNIHGGCGILDLAIYGWRAGGCAGDSVEGDVGVFD
jgi:hypothetical protein